MRQLREYRTPDIASQKAADWAERSRRGARVSATPGPPASEPRRGRFNPSPGREPWGPRPQTPQSPWTGAIQRFAATLRQGGARPHRMNRPASGAPGLWGALPQGSRPGLGLNRPLRGLLDSSRHGPRAAKLGLGTAGMSHQGRGLCREFWNTWGYSSFSLSKSRTYGRSVS